jgi:uncharacterized protein
MKKICLYHKNCMDGLGAAYAVWAKDPSYTFTPIQYGEELPNLAEYSEVLMVDFSISSDYLENLLKEKKVIIIDHHEKAEKHLGKFIGSDLLAKHKGEIVFDTNNSGAVLAWNYFNKYLTTPLLLKYIEDRDLWRWKMEDSQAISMWLSSEINFSTITFREFASIAKRIEHNIHAVIPSGRAMIKYKDGLVDSIARNARVKKVKIGENIYEVPIVNSSILQSEVGNIISKDHPFGIVFFENLENSKTVYSLRSSKEGLNVSEIAECFGGGGHKHAAGFILPTNETILI